MKKLTDKQIDYLLENGEFSDDVIKSAKKVAVILTQNWCPQWIHMHSYTKKMKDFAIFYIEYNRSDVTDELMPYKEQVFNNHLIPYVRFYENGVCFQTTNYITKKEFERLIS